MTAKKTTKKTAQGPKEVKETKKAVPFRGSLLLKAERFEYTPDDFLDALNFDKENRPIFILEPLNSTERHKLDQDGKRMSSEGLLWAKKNDIDIQPKENFYLLVNKWSEFSDVQMRNEIVRKKIKGFKNTAQMTEFKEDEDGGLSKDIFEKFPQGLISALDAALVKNSALTGEEVLGL